MRIYIAGRMTGLPQFGFHAFNSAAEYLRARGHDVISPAELDDPRFRRIALASSDGDAGAYFAQTGESRGVLLGRDIRLVLDEADAIAVLRGWRRSRGARLETFAAWLHDKPVLYCPTLRRVPRAILFSAWTGKGMP